jgi:hypothetical protein
VSVGVTGMRSFPFDSPGALAALLEGAGLAVDRLDLVPHPIVTAATCRAIEPVAPHPEIEARRQALGLDYGKLDYVVRDGEAILLDVNKTTARASLPLTPERLARWRDRAAGLFAYLDGEPGRRRAALPVDG